MKKIILGLCFIGALSSNAQTISDTGALRTYINAYIVPNGTRSITAQQLNAIFNAYLNLMPSGGGGVADSVLKSYIFDSVLYRPTPTFYSTDSIYIGGHSIAYGLDASPQDSSWSYQVAAYYGRPVANYAIVGAGITSVVRQNNIHIGAGNQMAGEFMGGLNTIRSNAGGMSTYEKVVNGYAAIFVNQFSKNNYPASGSSPVTRYGSGWSSIVDTADGSKSTNVAYTNNIGDSIVFAFTDSSATAVLMGCDSSGTVYNGSVVAVYLDNVLQRTVNTSGQTDGFADPAGGYPGHLSPMAIIFKGLPYGQHTLKIVNTQANYLYVDYFANLVDLHQAYPMLIMHDPYITTAAWGGTNMNGDIDVSNHKIDSLINTLKPYPVFDGITENYYTALAGTVSGDGIHPIDPGYDLLTLAGIAATDSVYTPGRLIYSGNYANGLYINTATGSEKVLTSKNFTSSNGVVINCGNAQLDPSIFTVVPGFHLNGNNGYVGINTTDPGAFLDVHAQPGATLPYELNLTGVAGNTQMSFSSYGTLYASIGLGGGILFSGAYNDFTAQAFGNINLVPASGTVNIEDNAKVEYTAHPALDSLTLVDYAQVMRNVGEHGLKVVGDASYTVAFGDESIIFTTTTTAARTLTLPVPTGMANRHISVCLYNVGANGIQIASTATIYHTDGTTGSIAVNTTGNWFDFVTDGTSWYETATK
jgi:hypothetical protein